MSDSAARLDYCPTCAAEVRVGDELCWLCKARLADAVLAAAVLPPPDSSASAPRSAAPSHARLQAAVRARERLDGSKSFLYVALVVIALGVLLTEPAAIIGLAVMAAPALIAVEVASRRAAKSDRLRERPRVVLSFVLMAILTNVLLGLAAFTALGLACLGAAGAYGGGSPSTRAWGSEEFFIAAACLGLLGAFVVIMRLSIHLAGKLMVSGDRRGRAGTGAALDPTRRQSGGMQLSTVMIVIAELTVAIGIGQSAPGLGVLMGFLLVPGTLHLARQSQKKDASGIPPGRRKPVATFLMGSLMGLGLMLLASSVLLLYVCGL